MIYKRKKRICENAFSSSDLIDIFLTAHPKGVANNLVELWRHWKIVMGPQLSDLAYPLGARRESLLIGAEDNLVLHELSFFNPEILERANAFLETSYFVRVELSLLQGRSTLDTIVPLIDEVDKKLYIPLHNPVSRPAPGALGKLDIDKNTPLGKVYWKYVDRFGLQES